MKKIFLSFFFLLSFFPQSSFAFISYTNIECFKEIASLSPSENLFISTKYDDILAKQGENELQVILYDWVYKYIPFETNISQTEQVQKYKNTYNF